MNGDALLRDLADRIGDLSEKVSAIAAHQAAFKGEYLAGKKASMQVARDAAAFQSAATEQLSGLDQRTRALSGQLGRVESLATKTNGRVTELERDRIAREAVANVRTWRFPAAVTFLSSILAGTIVAVIALLIH